ncbi:hypothetical protein [Microbacterium sp. No. 7]|uniref:hypothetical protein n=1 Tax=Microbacterium sp. No. 7 TaxID=1714373 RepID=UPI0006D0E1CD|nr:hypothetical protein [Microbacterium sp. No. 7]ALJ19528.1 hypothetical protein AOA12_06240 [Microbacterium sp. No. 7]
MRIRIIIDTLDADANPDSPFTLNVYRDDDDDTPSREPLEIGDEGSCLVGYRIGHLLGALGLHWDHGGVLDQAGQPLPRTGKEWLDDERRERGA